GEGKIGRGGFAGCAQKRGGSAEAKAESNGESDHGILTVVGSSTLSQDAQLFAGVRIGPHDSPRNFHLADPAGARPGCSAAFRRAAPLAPHRRPAWSFSSVDLGCAGIFARSLRGPRSTA